MMNVLYSYHFPLVAVGYSSPGNAPNSLDSLGGFPTYQRDVRKK